MARSHQLVGDEHVVAELKQRLRDLSKVESEVDYLTDNPARPALDLITRLGQ